MQAKFIARYKGHHHVLVLFFLYFNTIFLRKMLVMPKEEHYQIIYCDHLMCLMRFKK